MNRYQVYLNPHSVALLDDFEKKTKVNRSQIIREAVDAVAEKLSRLFASHHYQSSKKTTFDHLVGIVHNKNQTTNFALKNDRAYLDD